METKTEHLKGVMFAMIASFMWGVLAIALKVMSHDLSAISIVWARFTIAFLVIGMFHIIKRPHAFVIFRRPPVKLLIAAVCLAVNYYGYMQGLVYTTPSSAQVFIQLGPVLFAIAGIIIFREHIGPRQIIGFVIVLAGFGLFFHENLINMSNQRQFSTGILLITTAAAGWAVFAIYQKELTKSHSTNQLNLFIYACCAVIFAPFVHYSGFHLLHIGSWMLVLFLGLNTVIAYGSIALAFRHLEANKVSVIITMNPVITFILMYLLSILHVSWIQPDHYSLISLLGAAMALGGAAFVILFSRK